MVSLLPFLAYYPAFEDSSPHRDSADVGNCHFFSEAQKAVDSGEGTCNLNKPCRHRPFLKNLLFLITSDDFMSPPPPRLIRGHSVTIKESQDDVITTFTRVGEKLQIHGWFWNLHFH